MNEVRNLLTTETKDKVKTYISGRPFNEQVSYMKDDLPAVPNVPDFILTALDLPVQTTLNVTDDVLEWGEFADYRHKVWCDAFFMLRASLVLVDLNVPTRNQQAYELVLAKMRGIPVIGVSDLDYVPAQALFCTTMVMPSCARNIVSMILKLVPAYSANEVV